jgi:outer membrane protein OmpA-like peptidoglycan-associated protein
MGRKSLTILAALFMLLAWTFAGVRIANADEGREPNDPRRVCHMGSYSGVYLGPWTAASQGFPNGSGVVLCGPDRTDDGTVGQFMHLPPAPVEVATTPVPELAKVVEEELGKINFAFDSSAVEEQYTLLLDKVAEILVAKPEIKVSLDGHTDRMGSDDYNQALGMRRSAAIQAELVRRGVPADQLTLVSFGESRVLVDVFTPERENRRVEVRTIVEE